MSWDTKIENFPRTIEILLYKLILLHIETGTPCTPILIFIKDNWLSYINNMFWGSNMVQNSHIFAKTPYLSVSKVGNIDSQNWQKWLLIFLGGGWNYSLLLICHSQVQQHSSKSLELHYRCTCPVPNSSDVTQLCSSVKAFLIYLSSKYLIW